MGGAVLGLLIVASLRFSLLRRDWLLVFIGALVGNVNAYWCSSSPVLHWYLPSNRLDSWTSAVTTFTLTAAVTLPLILLANRYVTQRADAGK